MSFVGYDIGLLVVFVLFVSLFLYRNRQNLKREGLLYLYKTKWGMRLIEKTAKKFPKTLKVLGYVCIVSGYLLMVGMIYLAIRIVVVYVFNPMVVQSMNNLPPIMPIIPYLPEAFNISFLPPLYFTYWIVILAVIAISHEFAHGIFMRRYGIKIKSTGFGFFPFFLPVFLAAFVEQDEKSMEKASKFKQKAVLAAGTFANVITAIIGFGLLVLFLTTTFTPAGVTFDNYAFGAVGLGSITSINNKTVNNATYDKLLNSMDEEGFNEIRANNESYLISKEFLERQSSRQTNNISAYYDSPAARAKIKGHIKSINDEEVTSRSGLSETLSEYSAGKEVEVETTRGNYTVKLEMSPKGKKVWLGIISSDPRPVIHEHRATLPLLGQPGTYYKPDSETAVFVEGLLEWLVLISLSVALINMLPMGIFDGGRFFYLTIWEITGSEKQGRKWFSFATYFFLFLLLVLMAVWAVNLI